ncbi:MAG: gliding motility lipoprotein GldH [Bacteroidota bacterium]
MKNCLLLFALLLLLSACGPNYILQKSIELPEKTWSYTDSLYATLDIADTNKLYNLYLDIEHGTSYANQNIYLLIKTQFPDGQIASKTLSVDLADKIGNWQGDCNAETCDVRVNLQQGAFFNAPGQYSFSIAQHMRIDPIPAIHGVGFSVEDTGKVREW